MDFQRIVKKEPGEMDQSNSVDKQPKFDEHKLDEDKYWNDDLDDDFDYFDIPCYINEKTVEKFSNVNFDDENCIQCWKFPDCLHCYLKTVI